MTHTPTPWEVIEVRTQCGRAFRIGSGEMLKAGKGACIIYDDYPGNPDNERSANAALIVRAVNSLPALVKALKTARESIISGFDTVSAIAKIDAALASHKTEG